MSLGGSPTTRTLVFIKIELDGKTLRYCTEDVVAKDTDGLEYFWEGRLLDVGDLSAGFNDFNNAQTVISSVGVELANGARYSGGSTLDDDIANYFWGNKTCTLFLGIEVSVDSVPSAALVSAWRAGAGQSAGTGKHAGTKMSVVYTTNSAFQLATTDIIFKGLISFPNVFDRHTESIVSFSVYDPRYNDQLLVNPNTYQAAQISTDTTFSGLGTGVEGHQIAVLYGDFSTTPIIPAFDISGFPYNANRTLKIADQASVSAGQDPLKSIDLVVLNSIALASTAYTTDLTLGNITINQNLILQDSICYVACSGLTRGTAIAAVFGGLSTTLLEHPVEVAYDLLVNRLGIDSGLVDSTSFTALQAADTTLKCRRYFQSATSIVDALNELCFEFGLELYSVFGKFYIQKQVVTGSPAMTIDDHDIVIDSYSIQTDPNRSFFNVFTGKFDHTLSDYLKSFEIEDEISFFKHDKTHELIYEPKWNDSKNQLVDRFSLLLAIYSGPIRTVHLSANLRQWPIKPTDLVSVTYHILNASNCLVRSISKSLKDFTTSMTLFDIGTSSIKKYALNADVAYTTYAQALAGTLAVYHADCEIIEGFNDSFVIEQPDTSKFIVILTPGVYEGGPALALELQIQIAGGYTVTYSASTRKFTIANNAVSNFKILWTDTTTSSGETKECGRSLLGFDISTDRTGAATYTADYPSIFDVVKAEAVSQWK